MESAKDQLRTLSDGVLMKRYAKLMHEIEICVSNVNLYVPKDLADAREAFEAEIAHRRSAPTGEGF